MLIERVLGGKALPREVMNQIVAKADGVPLFLEELTKAVLDAGLVVETARTERIDSRQSWTLSFRRDDPRWEAATRLQLTLLDADRACDLDVLQGGFHLLAMSSSLTIWEEYRRRCRDALTRLAERTG